jgi:hypothetical protein
MAIFLGNLVSVSETKMTIGLRHYMPFDEVHGLHQTQEELLQHGAFIAAIPQPEPNGKQAILYYNPVTRSVFYEYTDPPAPTKTQIELQQEQIDALRHEIETLKSQLAAV